MSSKSLLLELPHTSTGETDWSTLGNILSARILGEVLEASYVDRFYGRGSKEFVPDTDWKFVYKEDDVVALQKSYAESPIKAFMGRGVIDRPMEDIVYFLECHDRRREWDRYARDFRQVKAMSEKDFILHMQVEARNCLVRYDGEFLQYERMAYTNDEKYVRTAMSIELPEFPCKRNVVRLEMEPGTGWVLEPYNGSRSRTLVSYLAHVDLKVLPPVLTNRIMRRQPKAIHRIRKILMRSKTGRDVSPEDPSVDTFTTSEKRAVLAATLEYNHTHFDHRHYEEGVSIEEFTGRAPERPRRFHSIPPVLRYHEETDSFADHSKTRRSASVSSSTSTGTEASRQSSVSSKLNEPFGTPFSNGDLNHHVGAAHEPNGKAVTTSNGEVCITATSNGDPHKASANKGDVHTANGGVHKAITTGDGGVVGMLEVHVDSDPHISERTGFERDTKPPLSTTLSSASDTPDTAIHT